MTDNYRDEIREAFEAGYTQGHNDTIESCVRDYRQAADDYLESQPALSRLSARAEPAKDAREFVRDWIVANHGVLSMAGTAAQDLIVRLQARLSASGQGDTCIGCEHDGEQDKWRPCSSCARNSHDNYESRKS